MSNSNLKIFKQFKLVGRSKNPSAEWKKINLNKCAKTYDNVTYDGNLGIVTGKMNNIIVIDIDSYKGTTAFDKKFCVKQFKTLTVKTPSGGYHLYFNYDEDIKQTQCDQHNIDVRSDGGYIVAPYSIVKGNKYTIIKNKKVSNIPAKFKKWLLDNIYKKNPIKPTKTKKQKEDDININDKYYQYNKIGLSKLLSNLDKKWWTMSDNNFLKYTSAMKTLDAFDMWDEENKNHESYNKDNNLKIWEGSDKNNGSVDIVFGETFMAYNKFRKTRNIPLNIDHVINRNKLGYDFFEKDINYIVKSDTGTGKTTSFIHYIKNDHNEEDSKNSYLL